METTWKIIIEIPSRCDQNAGNGLQKSKFLGGAYPQPPPPPRRMRLWHVVYLWHMACPWRPNPPLQKSGSTTATSRLLFPSLTILVWMMPLDYAMAWKEWTQPVLQPYYSSITSGRVDNAEWGVVVWVFLVVLLLSVTCSVCFLLFLPDWLLSRKILLKLWGDTWGWLGTHHTCKTTKTKTVQDWVLDWLVDQLGETRKGFWWLAAE